MSLRNAIASIVLLGLVMSTAAYAAATGLYVQATGGYSMVSGDVQLDDLEGEDTGPIADVDLDLKDGYMTAVAVGYDWGNIRAEGEVSFREHDIDRASTSFGAPIGMVDGDVQAFSVMVNGIVDLPVNDVFSFYVGAGAGIAAIHIDTTYGTALSTTEMEIGTAALAYQGLAGVAVNITDKLAINFGYRIWSCFDTTFDDDWDNDDDDDDDDDEEDLEGDLNMPFIHTFEIGLRYTF